MYEPGEKVVCIDDDFDAQVVEHFTYLPTKNEIYVVRDCGMGRTHPTSPNSAVSYKITLVGMINPPDPSRPSDPEELGFRSDRFAPLLPDQEKELEEAIGKSGEIGF